MEATSSLRNSAPVRSESFYFDDDPMAIFLVENQLFKVHRHYFIQGSEIFRDMFSQASAYEDGPSMVVEGMSDDKPIVLTQVTVKEFKLLLRFFYAMTLPLPNKKTLAHSLGFKQDEQLALLSIAHRFVFDKVFNYICVELEPEEIPVVDRVRLGDKYCLGEWLSSAYKTILERTPKEKLTQEEIDTLGVKRTIEVLEVKNSVLYNAHPAPVGSDGPLRCPHCNHQWVQQTCGSCGRFANAKNPATTMQTAISQAAARLAYK